MDANKKKAAAISAVIRYLESAKETSAASPAAHCPPVASRRGATATSPWGLSGRQAVMQLRNMMKLKVVRN